MVITCDICGRTVERGYLIKIEGATLVACPSCAERGEIVQEITSASPKGRGRTTYVDIIDGYGRIIREARKRMKMDLRDLSRATGISVKVLRLIEEERIIPTEDQARKIEKALDIEIVDEEEGAGGAKGDDFTVTLGDVVRIR